MEFGMCFFLTDKSNKVLKRQEHLLVRYGTDKYLVSGM